MDLPICLWETVLGGKPKDPALLDNSGNVDYTKIAATKPFKDGIERLLQGLDDDWNIILLCAEENPCNCHRQNLIARELELNRKVTITYIRADGRQTASRKLFKQTPVQKNLF